MEPSQLFSSSIMDWLSTNSDAVIDYLLAVASDDYKLNSPADSAQNMPAPTPSHFSGTYEPLPLTPHSRFATPKRAEEVMDARLKGIPKRTQQDTQYCLKLWEEWRQHRQGATGEIIAPITAMQDNQLSHWLSCFVLEVRQKDGSLYTPSTLHHLTAGLQCHLRDGRQNIDLIKDPHFANFRASLDAEMKRISRRE